MDIYGPIYWRKNEQNSLNQYKSQIESQNQTLENELLVLNRERLASVQELKLFIDFGYRLKELMDRKLC